MDIVTKLRVEEWRIRGSIPDRRYGFFSFETPGLTVGPTGPCFPVVFARLMSETVPPLPPYAFTACIGTTVLSIKKKKNAQEN